MAKARRKPRKNAMHLSPELIPETEKGTIVPQLRRQRQQTQAISLGGELTLVMEATEVAAMLTRNDDRFTRSAPALLCV